MRKKYKNKGERGQMFAQLNTKTEYSFLDSVVRVDDYLNMAEKMGYKQLGICDVGNLHGAYHFAIEAQKRNIQPIIGVELVFELDSLPVSFSFIAKNTEGYKNLLKISSSHNYGRHRFSDIESFLNDVVLVVPESYANLSALSQIQAEVYSTLYATCHRPIMKALKFYMRFVI